MGTDATPLTRHYFVERCEGNHQVRDAWVRRKKRLIALYSLACEGYDEHTRRHYGGADRTVDLKSGVTVRMDDIPSYFRDKYLDSAVRFYLRYTKMGLPYQGWGTNPNVLVEIVEVLEPLDRLYHQKREMFGG